MQLESETTNLFMPLIFISTQILNSQLVENEEKGGELQLFLFDSRFISFVDIPLLLITTHKMSICEN